LAKPVGSTGRGRAWTRRACPQKGGERIGKNPTDRGKPGSKRHLVSDRKDVPLTVALRRRGIKGRIARRGVDSSEKLGRHRWVVERTLAWLARYRRLSVRNERRADIHEAFLHLGCSLICLNYLS